MGDRMQLERSACTAPPSSGAAGFWVDEFASYGPKVKQKLLEAEHNKARQHFLRLELPEASRPV